MKKDSRICIRISASDKALLEKQAEKRNVSLSEHLSLLGREYEATKNYSPSPSMIAGEFIASLYENAELSNKAKQLISKEMRKYV